MQRTLVLGIGNTLLSDEGLGIHLLEYLRKRHSDLPGITWLDGGTLSFTLAPLIEEHENLIVLDAAQLNKSPGTISLLAGEEMDAFIGHGKRSVHEVGLMDLMSIVKLAGHLPKNRALIGVQPKSLEWGEAPSEELQAALPDVCEKALHLIKEWQT